MQRTSNITFTFSAPKLIILAVILSAMLSVASAQVGSLRVFVGGRELAPTVKAERRGVQTWLPVVPLARELGYTVNVDNSAETIRVRRVGIEAEFSKRTAEISENGVTIVSSPFAAEVVFTPDTDSILLPIEAVASLLDVSIFVDAAKNAVRVESRTVSSAITSQERGKFEIGGINYTANVSRLNDFFYQNFNIISTGRIGSRLFQTNVNFLGGGSYAPINFYSGNFTLVRPQVDEIQFGDINTTIGNELTLINTNVRGASYTRYIMDERARFNIYGGRSYSGFTENFFRRTPSLPFDTTIFGGRLSFIGRKPKPNFVSRNNLSFSIGAVYFNGANNKGFIFDGTARYTTDKLNLEAQLAVGNFDITAQNGRKVSGFGSGIVASASYRPWRFLTVQGRIDRFSPNFSNPSRLLSFNNRQSESFSVALQPFNNLSFGFNATITDNKNPSFFRGEVLDKYRTESYGFNIGYDPHLSFLPRVSVISTTFKNPFFGNFNFLNATFSRDLKHFRPFVNYTRTKYNADASHGFNIGTTIETGKFGQFRLQHSFALSKSPLLNQQQVNCQLNPFQCSPEPNIKYRINNNSTFVDWTPENRLFKVLQFSVGGGYAKNSDKTSFEFRTSAGIILPFRQSFQISYFNGAFNREFRFTISGPLRFWKSKKSLNESESSEVLLTESSINGRIYLDENGNRQYDAGTDQPMNGVRVRLNNGSEAVSDINGNYFFERVQPGESAVTLNLEDVRANLIPANGLEQTLTIVPRSRITTDFRLVKSGSLTGRVWHDLNNNKIFDEGEGLPDVRIVSSKGSDTYTDQTGWFLLSELPPGEQAIYIDERYKPEDLQIDSSSLRAKISSGETTSDIGFMFKTKPRGVKVINFDAKPRQNSDKDGVKNHEK